MKKIISTLVLSSFVLVSGAEARDQECQAGPAVVAKITHDEKESLTCLDSEVVDGKVRSLVLSTKEETSATGGRRETNVVTVVSATASADGTTVEKIDSQTAISDASLFPRGCGAYLKGGLILPGAAKIALVYAQQIRTVDYSDAAHPVIALVNDRSIPGGASTCEGYTPNWNGGRQNLKIDAATGTLNLKMKARDAVEQPEEKKVASADHAYYEKTFALGCGGNSPEKKSDECKDLKRARDEGVFVLRRLVHPEQIIVMKY